MLLKWVLGLTTLLTPLSSLAQEPIQIDSDDVYFQLSGITPESPHTGTNIAKVGKVASTRLCGFAIRGNHTSRKNPHVEWDLNIDQIVTPQRRVAGISAGTFDVMDHKRTPRPAITQLSFVLQGAGDSIVAQIEGVPNEANGIVALLEAEPAGRLFEEFQSTRPIIISLHYADGSAERLEVRGWRDRRKFGGGKNSQYEECLRGFKGFVPGETIRFEKK